MGAQDGPVRGLTVRVRLFVAQTRGSTGSVDDRACAAILVRPRR
jgi:hypothetical protein